MNMRTNNEVFFQKYYPRYKKLHGKGEKIDLLNEITITLGYSRKHILKKLREGVKATMLKKSRKRYYNNTCKDALLSLWEKSGRMCAELFHPFIKNELTSILETKQFSCSLEVEKKVRKASVTTLKRTISNARKMGNIERGISTTKTTPRGLALSVAIRTSNWDIVSVGWHETDYVSHCGHSASGSYLSSLDFVDIKTKWCSLEVTPRANQQETFNAFSRIERRLPYKLKGINPDNGSPLLNYMIVNYYKKRGDVEYTRSRAYKKNDNALVERKNCTIIRKYVGYRRYESAEAYRIIQELYRKLEIFLNYFQPTQVVTKVELVNGKCRRIRQKGKTPYEMVLLDKTVRKEKKNEMRAVKKSYHVLELVKEIQNLKRRLKELPN